MLGPGDTFLSALAGNDTPHLWVILTPPDENNHAICVNLTTRGIVCDTTTICKPKDHPFIMHESIVYYAGAELLDMDKVAQALMDGNLKGMRIEQKDRCDRGLFKRLHKGLLASPFTPRKIKEHYTQCFEKR